MKQLALPLHEVDWRVEVGDCLEVMATMEVESIDAIVTDPPYGIHFMGKSWDRPTIDANIGRRDKLGPEHWRRAGRSKPRSQSAFANAATEACGYNFSQVANEQFEEWCAAWAYAALRVAKPGTYLVSFGGTRTFHRLTCALEDAGWEIRDCLCWLYGSGFPKSLNVGEGRGTALKPAWEPIILSRKPLVGTVATNVEKHGTGALSIDACRIQGQQGSGVWGSRQENCQSTFNASPENQEYRSAHHESGRWPANVLLDEEAAAQLDAQAGEAGAFAPVRGTEPRADGFSGPVYGAGNAPRAGPFYADSGGPSRFFYCAKASRSEREAGCEHLPARTGAEAVDREDGSAGTQSPRAGAGRVATKVRNYHPTVKPVELMRWLVRLVTSPGGLVLDPFMGSGTTGCAAALENRRFLGIEKETEYIAIAKARIQHWTET